MNDFCQTTDLNKIKIEGLLLVYDCLEQCVQYPKFCFIAVKLNFQEIKTYF
jgi:hypothetical protein